MILLVLQEKLQCFTWNIWNIKHGVKSGYVLYQKRCIAWMNIQNKYSKIMYIKMYKYYVKMYMHKWEKGRKNREYREKEEGESEKEELSEKSAYKQIWCRFSCQFSHWRNLQCFLFGFAGLEDGPSWTVTIELVIGTQGEKIIGKESICMTTRKEIIVILKEAYVIWEKLSAFETNLILIS